MLFTLLERKYVLTLRSETLLETSIISISNNLTQSASVKTFLRETFSISNFSEKMAYRGFMPLANRVLVQRAAAVTKSAGGIMLPESSLQKQNIATVLAVGEGALTEVK